MCPADPGHFGFGGRCVLPGLQDGILGSRGRPPLHKSLANGVFLPRSRPLPGPLFTGTWPCEHFLKPSEKLHHDTSHSAARRTACITSSRVRVRSRRIRLPWAIPNFSFSAFASSLAIEANPPACKIAAAFSSITCFIRQVARTPEAIFNRIFG